MAPPLQTVKSIFLSQHHFPAVILDFLNILLISVLNVQHGAVGLLQLSWMENSKESLPSEEMYFHLS